MTGKTAHKKSASTGLAIRFPSGGRDDESPSVDEEKLKMYVEGELSDAITARIHQLIAMYPAWARAYNELVAQHYQGSVEESGSPVYSEAAAFGRLNGADMAAESPDATRDLRRLEEAVRKKNNKQSLKG